jgi:hypothetical protein
MERTKGRGMRKKFDQKYTKKRNFSPHHHYQQKKERDEEDTKRHGTQKDVA